MDRLIGSPAVEDALNLTHQIAVAQPDVVYHLAGQSQVAASWADPLDTFQANTVGTLNILRACIDAQVKRLIAVSSSDIYGLLTLKELPITEQAPLRPVSPYAASKAAAEMLCIQSYLGYQLEVIRARAFNHLGPGQSEHFLAAAIAARIARNETSGESTVLVGDLTPSRDFTDVRDVVRAYRLLALHGIAGEAYNVCSGHSITAAEIADTLLGLAKTKMTLQQDANLLRPVEVPTLRGDNSKITQATGWTPAIPLLQTLTDVLSDARLRLKHQTSNLI